MIGRTLLLIGAAAALAVPVGASADGGMSAICHRTGAPAPTPGLFQGRIIEVSDTALSMHVGEHGDVVIPPALRARFGSSRVCQTDGRGALFDSKGRPVQPTGSEPGGPSPIEEDTPS
ncbi:MAG: hypothetical protein KY446_05825 [Proteobacteria bacterium]|nr:hypothetical protein [Pseudomonadota bacterium]MBW3617259.1 hypothetical protein [Pseudomonadota bacterium]